MFAFLMHSRWWFLLAAAVMTFILCLFPVAVRAPEQRSPEQVAVQPTGTQSPALEGMGVPAGADVSERTAAGCQLHRTLFYAPCGHSVQRREALPTPLVGLSRAAFEQALPGAIPGAAVTGFSAGEVDISVQLEIPCPLHWVLGVGGDGLLVVRQNRAGESLEDVRRSDVPLEAAPQEDRQALLDGRVFDDVQALEGYLESLSS